MSVRPVRKAGWHVPAPRYPVWHAQPVVAPLKDSFRIGWAGRRDGVSDGKSEVHQRRAGPEPAARGASPAGGGSHKGASALGASAIAWAPTRQGRQPPARPVSAQASWRQGRRGSHGCLRAHLGVVGRPMETRAALPRRAVTGRIPRDVFGWEGDDLPQVARERMARLAILLAAIVLRESTHRPWNAASGVGSTCSRMPSAFRFPHGASPPTCPAGDFRLPTPGAPAPWRWTWSRTPVFHGSGPASHTSARAWRRVRRSESRRPWRRLSVLFWRLASRGSLLIVASVMNSSSSSRGIATGSTTGRCFVTRH